jgi:hypothetical protein
MSLVSLSSIDIEGICEISSWLSSVSSSNDLGIWSEDDTLNFELCSDKSGSALKVPESSSSKLTMWAFFLFFFFSFFLISVEFVQFQEDI